MPRSQLYDRLRFSSFYFYLHLKDHGVEEREIIREACDSAPKGSAKASKMRNCFAYLFPGLGGMNRVKTLLTLNSLSRVQNRRIVAQMMAMWPFFRK